MHLQDLTLCDVISAHLVSGKVHPAVSGFTNCQEGQICSRKTSPLQDSPSWIKNKRKSLASAPTAKMMGMATPSTPYLAVSEARFSPRRGL